ncbi:tRNA (adenosine(37)-N6)-threonylcarbamoyltransferase complex transferase subunit TsaD [Microvenator marinus]|jgi:N6-L-threonylcarbamoyladenine synthase|uniref:tRNA N6-adenosine threonylcarbamoyltransferase n=1 Tax=Microvenator marinus TaxID=2600177 RepID=A0A5B8XRV9_9DELT|nr:tRNA (adenosine(37)-N6)-threonylcarbamoyltransferase complex transferase subunit TsaD [Microvenator marinus]QED28284.1 tRNA (adenosine(37)-N6)-threonylcarbamoyltransferase complex transferase subunit TsaD [Microvenator marinus]
MLVLTIESSCDETSAAVIRDGRAILSNIIASQIPVHQRYGGVVPELASRSHVVDITGVIEEALGTAGVELKDIDGFAVTSGPGLVGSLLVGIETAKALGFAHDKPCIGVNHLEGHLTAVLLDLPELERPAFPYIGVIVSGGHTDVYVVRGLGEYELLGRTRDDAAGEAFDKVAKLLGLPYPGGVVIDQLASTGNPEAIEFPRPMWTRKHFDFSFSGLKTAVLQHVEANGIPEGQALSDLAASFQAAVVDVLVMKALEACKKHKVPRLVFSGGVACNSALRRVSVEEATKKGVSVYFAPPRLCTDNAAMLGPIAEHYLQDETGFDAWDLEADANMPLGKSLRAKSKGRHR